MSFSPRFLSDSLKYSCWLDMYFVFLHVMFVIVFFEVHTPTESFSICGMHSTFRLGERNTWSPIFGGFCYELIHLCTFCTFSSHSKLILSTPFCILTTIVKRYSQERTDVLLYIAISSAFVHTSCTTDLPTSLYKSRRIFC